MPPNRPQRRPLAATTVLAAFLALAGTLGCGATVVWPSGASVPPSAPPRTPAPPPSPPVSSPLVLVDMTEHASARVSAHSNVERGIILGSWDFDRDLDGYIDDRERFKAAIRQRVPRTFTGLVALDWEHTMTAWIKKGPGTPQYARALRHLNELLQLAKEQRPNAKIGYYGLPLHEYWNRNEAWQARSRGLIDVLRNADWVGPSIYPFYSTDEDVPAAKQRAFAIENVTLALEIARAAGDKPVYTWVTHRFQPDSKSRSKQLVPDSQMTQTLGWILSARYEDRRVRGIIWWGNDTWYHKQGTLEVEGDASVVLKRVHEHYLGVLSACLAEHR